MRDKNKIYLLALGLMFLIVISDNKLKDVIGVDNYSNYLYNEPIVIQNDKALILRDLADGSNSYRNLFESGFVFPTKLQSDMFTTRLQGTNAKYTLQQVQLSNLDNDMSFKDFSITDDYNKSNYPTNSNIQVNKGIYDGIENNSLYYRLWANSDITTELKIYPAIPTTHYTKVNAINISDYIYVDDTISYGKKDKFGLIDFVSDSYIYSLNFNIYTYGYATGGSFGHIYLYDGNVVHDENIPKIFGNYLHTFIYNVNLSYSQLNNAYFEWDPTIPPPGQINRIYYFYIDCYLYSRGVDVLDYNDNCYYNFTSAQESYGNHYPAQYSFENDAIGSNPAGWTVSEPAGTTVQVIASIGSHDKIVELYDNSGTNQAEIYNSITDKTYGTIEVWMRITATNKRSYLYLRHGATDILYVRFMDDGYISVSNGAGATNLQTYNANQWYHIRIDFECTTGSYYGLAQYKFHVYIDGVHYGDYSFISNQIHADKFSCTTHDTLSGFYYYIDAVDYSWASDYYLNRNRYPYSQCVNITITHQIPLPNLSYHQLNSITIDYSSFVNISQACFQIFQYNFYTHVYNMVKNEFIYNYLTENSYQLSINNTHYNSSYYIITKIVCYYGNNLLWKFDKFRITANYINLVINDNGYHQLDFIINRHTIANASKGINTFSIKFYKTYLKYSYSEKTNGIQYYYIDWQTINYEIENISNIEVQVHCRFGLNTLDINIQNYYFEILIDYNQTIKIYEQQRFFFDDTGDSFIQQLKYSCMNRNRFNLTGIFGNYSYNCLNGLRYLRGTTSMNYDRYFTIPFFNDGITLLKYSVTGSSESNPAEPTLPFPTYWTYQTFRAVNWKTEPIIVGNWTVDYNYLKVEQYTAKYPYNTKSIDNDDLGTWKWKIKFSDTFSYTVDFTFMRNSFADIINLILLFMQLIMYGLTAGLSFIFMYLISILLVFIWNYPLYLIFSALVWVLWYIFEGLSIILGAIWEGLVWVYENLLIPFLDWFFNVGFPLLVDLFIITWAFLITCLLFAMSLGQINFAETYDTVYDMLWTIADFVWLNIVLIIENLPALFIALGLYLLLIGMTYVTYVYCKARGFKDRAEALYDSLMTYLLPITLTYQIIKKIYDAIPTAG